MLFREIEHQDRAISTLRQALAGGRVHHAYLFEGPEGVGKEAAARALAAGLLCLDQHRRPQDDPCGECDSCRLLKTDNHPDYRLIHRGLHKQHPDKGIRDSKGLFLVVDVIRHFLIEPATNRPTLGHRRVFLIRDAERMNEGAQNALLKTLEEPPGEACLILVSSSGERLLPTIRSRCQRIPFDLLPKAFITQKMLEQTQIDPAAARALAALADGRLGAALQWHRIGLLTTLAQTAQVLANGLPLRPEAFGKALLEIAEGLAIRTIEQVEHFADENRDDNGAGERSRASSKIETDDLRAALKLTFMLIAAIHRDALVRRTTADDALRALPQVITASAALAHEWDADQLGDRIRAVATAERMLDRNVSPQLVCEHLAIGLSGDLTISETQRFAAFDEVHMAKSTPPPPPRSCSPVRFGFEPLTPDRWPDFERLFGQRGACGGCWCMWWRLKRSVFNENKGASNKRAMKKIVAAGPPPGILAYADGRAVGWCALRPRSEYPAFERSRVLKPVDDQPVWSITCFFIDKAHRRRGLSKALIVAATEYARKQGARIIEGYPVEPKLGSIPDAFAWTGLPSAFQGAGFVEVLRRTPTRPILRYIVAS